MTLSVDNINLFYGASHCLRGVTLGAVPGSITCVLGRNGVGKSSLMRSIVGLERVRSGRITWEGRDITTLAPAERARAGRVTVGSRVGWPRARKNSGLLKRRPARSKTGAENGGRRGRGARYPRDHQEAV